MKVILGLIFIFSVSAQAVQGDSCVITTQTDFGATTVSIRALSTSPYRKCLVFQMKGATTAYIKFGSAHTGTEGVAISGASTFWMPIIVPINSVYIKSSAGTVPVVILEGR